MRMNKKLVAITAGVAIVLAGGGLALAYWTTTGAGSGSGKVASSNGTIALTATFADGITPGGSVPVSFKATNAGSSNLQVGTVTTVVSTTPVTGTCDASWFAVAPALENQTIAHGAINVALTAGSYLVFTDDLAVNQDGCKGATITLTLTSN